ncbi:hypothetical protein [Sunxiuqinia dokdonensis]|uniref:hypothetical protein n=1 Tax=Sunxiuqinia dokdonensis TaxID=1409788 RepID=UPI00069D7EBD|nr:hypothetical protein [Sunxiuqinia dokdonensis]
MKKLSLYLVIALFGSLFVLSSCDDKDDPIPPVEEEETEFTITSNISEDTTWETGNVYVLGNRVSVLDGATLTIEPGVIVKGQAGTGANATALLVARGGKLMAEGTADAPIIFTSVADELSPEDVEAGIFGSPNLDPDINGLWGGVIVLGKAPISASNESGDVSEVQIEGIPTSDTNGLYGGNQAADNSGVIKYISIRHGGTNIGSGNEINGLTLGGVGSETVIENVEVVANQDDGIEWFGGTVNVKNALVWNVGDDGIDTDQSWNGTLDNFVVVTPTGHGFELDGPEGSMEAGHIIKNGTVVSSVTTEDGTRSLEDLINVDDNSIVDLMNIFITGIIEGQMINRVTAAGVTFEGIELDVAEADLASHVNGDVPAGVTAVSSPTVGADASVFGWTWASKAGALTGL